METKEERRKRLRAAIDRAKSNPNASDKGDGGSKIVEAEKRRVKKLEADRMKAKSENKSKKTSAGQSGASSRNRKIDKAVRDMT